MRLPPAIVASTEEALREVLRFTAAADMVLSRYFREHPRLGGRERGIIAEAVFAVLRRRVEFGQFAESGTGSATRRLGLLGLASTLGPPVSVQVSDRARVAGSKAHSTATDPSRFDSAPYFRALVASSWKISDMVRAPPGGRKQGGPSTRTRPAAAANGEGSMPQGTGCTRSLGTPSSRVRKLHTS